MGFQAGGKADQLDAFSTRGRLSTICDEALKRQTIRKDGTQSFRSFTWSGQRGRRAIQPPALFRDPCPGPGKKKRPLRNGPLAASRDGDAKPRGHPVNGQL